MMGLVIVAILVAVFLVVLLAVTGAFSSSGGGGGSSTGASGALSYDGAMPIADRAANASGGGAWTLVIASGVLPLSAATENASSSGSSGCNFTLAPGAPSTVTSEPGGPGTAAGTATTWVFLYRNATNTILAVVVLNGTAFVYGSIASGQTCSLYLSFLNPIPDTVLDSTTVAADVASSAAPFLGEHPNVTAVYAVIGGYSVLGHTSGSEWELNYTTCPFGTSGGSIGASFNATVNGDTGAVVYSRTTPSLVCPAGSTITLVAGDGSAGSAASALVGRGA